MADGPRILMVEEWGGILRDTHGLKRRPAVWVTLHHTAGHNTAPLDDPARERERCFELARSIQRHHLARGWRDSGHHFLLTRSGLILEGRHGSLAAARMGFVIAGAHAGHNEANTRSWGLELEGNTELAPVTPEQWAACVELCAWLSFVGNTQARDIFPHRNYRPTACPGAWLMANLDRLREETRARKLDLLIDRL